MQNLHIRNSLLSVVAVQHLIMFTLVDAMVNDRR
ncbi:hypothetical protein RB2150_16789 [Rhodobacterales bacterium HTCC2150]|nr:hypothetical protein RB2150_16789 [Rhodobacterales bacterium HTCC2150] [Rhodobacteraceae bacterium HTCC2150]